MSQLENQKDIIGYEGLYAVTNDGKVWSYKNKCFLKNIVFKLNYLRVNLYKNKKGKLFFVHRLVAGAFIPNPDNKPEVNHIDSNPSNNHVSNLEWVTISENNLHAFKYGNNNQNHTRKLTIQQVNEIRKLYKENLYTHRQLAKMYHVCKTTIGQILNNKVYREVLYNE